MIAALLVDDRKGTLEYAGKAMIAVSGDERHQLWERLQRVHVEAAPLPGIRKLRKSDGHWFKPSVRVTVHHLRGEAGLRHAAVRSLATTAGQKGG